MALDRMRRPLFVLAVVLFALAVILEAGSRAFSGAKPAANQIRSIVSEELKASNAEGVLDDSDVDEIVRALERRDKPPGLGIPYLAWLDTIILYVICMIAAGLILPAGLQGKLQAIVTLVVSIITLVISIVMIFGAFQLLLIMVALFTAAPFGTIAYMAMWGFFNRPGARVILAASLALKLGFGVSLVAAHQRYLRHGGFIFLTLFSLLGNVVISFLHGWVPLPLVSITDAIAAIVVGILAVIVSIVLLVGAVIGIVKLVL